MTSSARATLSPLSSARSAHLRRRDFIKGVAIGASALASGVTRGHGTAAPARVALGLDAHFLRGMPWQARQLVDPPARRRRP